MKPNEVKEELKDEAVKLGTLKRINRQSPSFGTYYANDTQLQTSPWDVRFTFGLIEDINQETQTLVVEQVADVRMSLQHAKRVAAILIQQIENYENTIGPIPQPPARE